MGITGSDREHDVKRHLKRYHHTDSLWLCPEPDCGHFSEWRQAFDAHLKKDHDLKNAKKDPRYEDDKVMIPLCRQVAFACGYFGCKHVSVALDTAQVEMKMNEYHNHIKDHHKKGIPHQGWSRATRFRNLLRQSEIMNRAWKQMAKDLLVRCQPHNSLVLMKMLETRHIPEAELFVRYAIELASGRGGLPVTFRLPKEGGCGIDHEHLTSALLGPKNSVSIGANQELPVENPTELDGPFGNYPSSTHADAPSLYHLQQHREASCSQAYNNEMFMETPGNDFIATIDPQIHHNQNSGLSSVLYSHSVLPIHGKYSYAVASATSASSRDATYKPSTTYSPIAPSHQAFGHNSYVDDLMWNENHHQ